MAGAVAGFGGVFAIAIAAAGWRSDQQLIALVLGLAGGCLLGGVLVAPYFRRSGSATPGDFLAARFGSRAVSAIAGLVAAVALFPMLVAQLHVAGMIAELTLGIGSRTGIVAAAVLMILAPLLGGMRGITLSALVQFLFVLPALAATTLWIVDSVPGSPLSLIAYGLAASNSQGSEIVPALQAASGTWRDIGLALCIALGIAVFPPLLARAATGHSASSTRSSFAWALLFVAIFATCAAMIAGIARHVLAETARDAATSAQLIDAAPWIAHWAAKDPALVKICGKPALDMAACGTQTSGPGDLAIDAGIALLAAPDMAGLPPLASMLLGTGCLVLALAAASLVLFGIGAAVGHDLYVRGADPRAPVSRQLMAQRLAMLTAAGLAAYVATDPPASDLRLALWSLSLAASALFPVFLLAIWWRRANRWGAMAGLLVGFAVAAYLVAATAYDAALLFYLEPAGLAEIARALGAEMAPLAAIHAALLAMVLISLVTPAPGADQRAFAGALTRPRDMATEDERE
jgi:cation/acetate symporter